MRQATALKTFEHDGTRYRRGQPVVSTETKLATLRRNGLVADDETDAEVSDQDVGEPTAEDLASARLNAGAAGDRHVTLTFATAEAASRARVAFAKGIEAAAESLDRERQDPPKRETKPRQDRQTKPRQEPRRQATSVEFNDRRQRGGRKAVVEEGAAVTSDVGDQDGAEDQVEDEAKAAEEETERRAGLTEEERQAEDDETARRDAMTAEERAAEDGADGPPIEDASDTPPAESTSEPSSSESTSAETETETGGSAERPRRGNRAAD